MGPARGSTNLSPPRLGRVNNAPEHTSSEASAKSLNRQILALALPAFGALISEPLFILADTAIVGHLGTPQLAGLSVASTVVQTVIGLMIFLSYSTTPAVAKFFGARNLKAAYEKGRDGLWVAFGLGLVLAIAGWILAPAVLGMMGAQKETLEHAVAYMRWSMPGLPGMLIVLAALGILRGLQDTKTPLYVAATGAAVNVILNMILVFPLHLGVAGSAMGTSLVQWGMAAVYLVMIVGGSRDHDVCWTTSPSRVGAILSVGSWLMLRTASMRAAMLLTVLVVTHQGPVNLAAYQLTMSLFGFMAFGLDALAIAAQALLGKEMGSRNLSLPSEKEHVRRLMNRLIRWSVGFGVITGLICPIIGYGFGWAFTPDPHVQQLFGAAMIVVAIGQPLASYVFILDGVLIGAEDVKYLALASFISLVIYAPMLWGVFAFSADRGGDVDPRGFVWVWIAYAMGFMGLRGITLGWRSRSNVWIRA
ncbi:MULTISPECIES: MATE family efflux transporter [Micrococcaceae]|uniref:MATE family efflux transporter n=1 Tax=unclassified Kocuria TaxID=2649579 RepID=UPI001010D7C0